MSKKDVVHISFDNLIGTDMHIFDQLEREARQIGMGMGDVAKIIIGRHFANREMQRDMALTELRRKHLNPTGRGHGQGGS